MKPISDTHLSMLGKRCEEVIGWKGVEQIDAQSLTHMSVGMMNEEKPLVVLLIGHHAHRRTREYQNTTSVFL